MIIQKLRAILLSSFYHFYHTIRASGEKVPLCLFLWTAEVVIFDLGLLLYVPVNSYCHVRPVSSLVLTTLFSWASLTKRLTSTSSTCFCLQLTTALLESAEWRRMTVEIISWSISTKVWDWTRIKLETPGSAVRQAAAVRHIADCATLPGVKMVVIISPLKWTYRSG